MNSIMKRASAGAVLGGSLLFTAGLGMAGAQPLNLQDGLVNVGVGDVTILEDVNVGVAATVAAAICGINVSDVNVLATQVDADGGQQTVCDVPGGDVLLTQNAGTPGQSGQAPGGGPATAPGNPTPGGNR
ncbi:hypothetical protein MGALJ_55900 [Mycobacterium gallinarum]|uniref:Uncharacterized protein n=1 Tax=Mycobacterium gallinarum TaxID=39689 RepID=A0A9W4FI98_9MYCO|nr:hypothetical protein [Mycobacterium gallinarum]BBY95921.1 hypothetical protein MGALJ_55900 [Mycobacterium gallinarum]